MDEDMQEFADFIPAEGFPLCGVKVVSYIDEDGNTRHKSSLHGNATLYQVLGMLEILKAELLRLQFRDI